MRSLIILICAIYSIEAIALDIKVRLFSTHSLSEVNVTPDTSAYFLIALDKKLRPIDTILDIYQEEKERKLSIAKSGNDVKVRRGDKDYGTYSGLLIISKNHNRQFRIDAARKYRAYYGDLRLRVYGGELQVVNIVDLEMYVGGVVESEGGHLLNPEYFKAQAVLARTFALKNWNKHASEGYNLKDDVSSQVYFSKARYQYNDAIREAVECTKDTVLVTALCQPILGVFHANSGGQTVGAQDAWRETIGYLGPRQDSFSHGVGSYSWEKTVDKKSFYAFIASSLGVPNDVRLQKAILNFDQTKGRKAYFEYDGKKLKLTRIRFKFNLRSTFFKVDDKGAELLITGYGYGHGVGLSQDGAMEMDRRGYNYREILHFYYDEVDLESIQRLGLD